MIVGAGAVGTATATLLAEQGHQVTIITRSGSGPSHPAIRLVSADATDTTALATHAAGAKAIFNCANPPYDQWTTLWPPLAASILSAAESTGAVLVTMSNLYGYGETSDPMSETDQLCATSQKGRVRAQMWADALAAHQAGKVRATEARASDFIGAGLGESAHMGIRVTDKILAGKTVSVIGSPDQPHSWTAIDDVATTLVAIAGDERAWGRAWHVPSAAPATQRQLIGMLCEAGSLDQVKVKGIPRLALRMAGMASPTIREMIEISYQFEHPFVIDSQAATRRFGIEATPLSETIAAAMDTCPTHSIGSSRH